MIIIFLKKIGNEAAVILDFQASLSCKNLLFVSPQTINRSAITTRSLRQAQGHGQTKPLPRQVESTAQLSGLQGTHISSQYGEEGHTGPGETWGNTEQRFTAEFLIFCLHTPTCPTQMGLCPAAPTPLPSPQPPKGNPQLKLYLNHT